MVTCFCTVLRKAGWHFTSVMNNADLLKKLRSFVGGKADYQVADFSVQRTVHPNSVMYLKDFELEDAGLP